jgi:hypothetical protein
MSVNRYLFIIIAIFFISRTFGDSSIIQNLNWKLENTGNLNNLLRNQDSIEKGLFF